MMNFACECDDELPENEAEIAKFNARIKEILEKCCSK